jgi:hypothetical protein
MKGKAENLINKYLEGTCTPHEKAIVEAVFLNDYKCGYAEISSKEIDTSTKRITNAVDSYLDHKNRTKRRCVCERYISEWELRQQPMLSFFLAACILSIGKCV